jgi:ATP-dependent DNA helicase RecG
MNLKQIKEDIQKGEGLHREFKEAGSQLPRNLFETVCAFLNTDGGTILLGVADDGTVTGVNPDAVERMKSDLANLSNNPQKVDPPYLLFPREFELDGKTIIAVQVPLSSQLHKTGGEIFLRSEDGDYRVQGTHQLAGLINRKLSLFTEQRALPFVTMEQLRPELFDRARRLMRSYNSKHPWADLSNEELLQIGGFYAQDHQTGKTCFTLAAVLMFGTDLAIQQAVPAYKFDCLLRRDNVDRYDDRVMIYTNLIDAYDRMMEFIEKHLNDPFYQDEKANRVSLRDKIFREAISNIISHREYTGGAPARLMIYRDKVILDNPCTLHHFGEITPANLRPFSKNPTICKFMIQLGRFDQLGSGVTNINKYLPFYANGAKPVFNETRHGFELTIPLADEAVIEAGSGPSQAQVGAQVGTKLAPSGHQVEILRNCLTEKAIGELMMIEGRSDRTKFRNQVLNPLLEEKLLEMTIPDKPRSSKQKYRLTAKGKQLLEGGR